MNTSAVSFLAPAQEIPVDSIAQQQPSSSFASWLQNSINETNAKIISSDQQLQALATGQADNLHHVMIALEEARVSFQLMVQIRNKILEAYQDILRMQI